MILFALLEPVLCDVLDTTTVVFLFVEDTIDNIYIIIQYIHIYIYRCVCVCVNVGCFMIRDWSRCLFRA